MKVTFEVEQYEGFSDSLAVMLGEVEIGSICEGSDVGDQYGWYLQCEELGIPHQNTWHEKMPLVTLEEAKAQVRAYVESCLSSTGEDIP